MLYPNCSIAVALTTDGPTPLTRGLGVIVSQNLLEMRDIRKHFGGVHALKGVSFTVRHGEIHGLVGENGAGKSTLMKVLAGAYVADDGEVSIDGSPVTHPTTHAMREKGIAVIYQELAQAPHLSVAENVFLGRLPKKALGGVDWKSLNANAREVITRIGFDLNPRAKVADLSVAQRQIVEIAKAISQNARLVVLDEPSAVLADSELQALFGIMRRLAKEQNVSFIYISHRLNEIFDICQRVTVLRDGAVIDTQPIEAVTSADLIRKMVGRELKDVFPKKDREAGKVVMSVKGLTREGVLDDISFDVRAGEIVGLCGLAGSGRTEVLRAIAAADPIDGGQIELFGKTVSIRSPRHAKSLGVGLLSEDRKVDGLFLDQSVSFNVTIGKLSTVGGPRAIKKRKEKELVGGYVRRLGIKTPSVNADVRHLSGGNQQKCAIARQLNAGTKIFLIDEPTRGVDVGARRDIYEVLIEVLQSEDRAILMVSSELPEILGMCDRILVMREGKLMAELAREGATEEIIMQHATRH
ncbi:ribose transport system ATP-binding protein [Paraburkholderia youngii]|uniref:sugar ABC transporter ATP-binding protein n=1 Tax=Paraburkholderia youngii TaxID=2782701 RepID=UPI003D2595B8